MKGDTVFEFADYNVIELVFYALCCLNGHCKEKSLNNESVYNANNRYKYIKKHCEQVKRSPLNSWVVCIFLTCVAGKRRHGDTRRRWAETQEDHQGEETSKLLVTLKKKKKNFQVPDRK